MHQLIFTNRFKKDTKLMQRRGFSMEILKLAIITLEANGYLDQTFRPHRLSGTYSGYWEAHLRPDWIIIWKLFEDRKEIWLARTGTHSDLFT
jgi:mRNA interferase YafQ